MVSYLLLGATFGFVAVVQPGPMQAYLLAQAAGHGTRRTLPAAFAPLLSDIPVVTLSLLLLSRLPARFILGLRAAGGAFVLYLAWQSFRAWRRRSGKSPSAPHTAARGLFQAVAVNLLSPNPWIAWSLVLGPLLLKGWRESPQSGVAMLAGFYGVMVAGTAATIALFGAAGKLGPGVSRALIGVSAVALMSFGCYLLWSVIR